MSYTAICLGRNGDLMIGMSLFHHIWKTTGIKPQVIVSKDYADTLSGCSYIEPIVFDGNFMQLHEAHKLALLFNKKPVIVQVAGPKTVLDRLVYGGKGLKRGTDSFQKEMYRVSGHLDLWRFNLPLVFDKRDKEREGRLWDELSTDWHYKRKKQPLILVSTSGFSSPFQYTELLWELLKNRFSVGYNVVDISNLKAERIYDLLGIYEKAHCLIATDSAALHLAHAVPTLPVCALIADTPELWHGSAWRPNHISYIRYKNFARDYQVMFNAIENIGKPGSAFKV